jgi:hypothetical protein
MTASIHINIDNLLLLARWRNEKLPDWHIRIRCRSSGRRGRRKPFVRVVVVFPSFIRA